MKNTVKTYDFVHDTIVNAIESSEAPKIIQLCSLSALDRFLKENNKALKLQEKIEERLSRRHYQIQNLTNFDKYIIVETIHKGGSDDGETWFHIYDVEKHRMVNSIAPTFDECLLIYLAYKNMPDENQYQTAFIQMSRKMLDFDKNDDK